MSIIEDSKVEAGRSKNSPEKGVKNEPFLGIKGKFAASHEPRGLQAIQSTPTYGFCQPTKYPQKEEIDQETGEIITLVDKGHGFKPFRTPQQYRADRYAMKSVVNRLFPTSDTAKCCRAKIPKQKVTVHKDKARLKAFYSGVRQCASPWLCPVCAAKIAEKRSIELQQAIDAATSLGWYTFLVTATIPHGVSDDLRSNLDKLLNSWRSISQNRSGKLIRAQLQIEGTIRALEVTHSDRNGFHPHLHIIVFTSLNVSEKVIDYFFTSLWQACCVKAGLSKPSDEHGLTVQSAEKAAAYVAKGLWGLPQEMTKGYQKTAKSEKGMTPWGFLMEILKTGSKRCEGLFFIFAKAFKGRRQLRYSPGLKEKLGINVKSDEEIVATQEETAFKLAELTDDQWRAVMVSRCEASLLDLAERDASQIPEFLNMLQINYLKQWNERNKK